MRKILLNLTYLLMSGCASAGLNGACANVQVVEGSVPYVGGKVNGNVVICHQGCFGFGCSKPDQSAFAGMMSKYIEQQNGVNKMTIPGPGTIIYTESK